MNQSSNAPISEVICVCSRKDASTWQKSSAYIVKNIASKRYRVIVPDDEAPLFEEISASPFKVIKESKYTDQIRDLLIQRIPPNNSARIGWYLQQFIKISAARSAQPGEIVLIWDADTIPLKPINFTTPEGKLIYYKGSEHHKPYFKTINKLLGLKKSANFSFIAQCFVIKVEWVHEFCNEIENRFKSTWFEAIINCTDLNEGSGFSEYETLGTYILDKHADQILMSNNKWSRLGNSLIGSIGGLTEEIAIRMSTDFDFISFELWDTKNQKPRNKKANWLAFRKILDKFKTNKK